MWNSSKTLSFVILFLLAIKASAQDPVLSLAEKFVASREYEEAITEYKRYIFFHSHNASADLSRVYAKLGMALGNAGRWDEAVEALEHSIQTAYDDKARDRQRVTLAAIYISCQRYSTAKFLLLKLEMYSSDEEVRKAACFLRGVCCLYEHRWEEAKIAFEGYWESNQDCSSSYMAIRRLLQKATQVRDKSPSLAKWLSTFLPGAGQIYCGDWRNGLNALVLNTAVGYLIFSDLQTGQVTDALFNSLFLFQRFYQGNRANAEALARRRNDYQHRRLAEHILKALSERPVSDDKRYP